MAALVASGFDFERCPPNDAATDAVSAAAPDFEHDDEWVEWGGELYYAVDFTSGGAPIGLSEREMWSLNRQDSPRAGWVRARNAIERAFEDPDHDIEIGYVRKLGSGLARDAYLAPLDVVLQPRDPRSGDYVALLPRPDRDDGYDERVQGEAHVLGALEPLELSFRAPRPIAIVPDPHGPALVETAVAGIPLDPRPGRNHPRPWEVVAQVAAAVHGAPIEPCEPVLPPAASRREHAENMLDVLAGLDRPELRDAAQWIGENTPSEQPATLVHGDLLGHNVLLSADERPGLIDWERASFGDPAADLAVVTRGSRRPFKNPRGLERLLDAYAEAGGVAVTAREVRLYEILMVAGWYREALADGPGHVGRPDDLARQVARLVAWADASPS